MTTDDGCAAVSIVIPVYNEAATWRELLDRVLAAPTGGLAKQVVLVDDASTDGTREQLAGLSEPDCRVLLHESNRGKGAALRTGFAAATGRFLLVQDADLEYDPRDYPHLLAPLAEGWADAVFGSRFSQGRRAGATANWVANRCLTVLFDWVTGAALTDMETCYKAFRRDLLDRLTLREDRFGFEPEFAAGLIAAGATIREVPIRYCPRGRQEGKKIGWRDGLGALRCIVSYGPRARRAWLRADWPAGSRRPGRP